MWLIVVVSLWAGFAANVALWRALAGTAGGMGQALTTGFLIAGAAGALLSLLGWRKMLKPAATLALLVAGLAAASIWSQALPVDATLLAQKPSSVVVPSWASLLRWQVLAAVAGLGSLPAIWVWRAHLRRLPAGHQLGVNIAGLLTGSPWRAPAHSCSATPCPDRPRRRQSKQVPLPGRRCGPDRLVSNSTAACSGPACGRAAEALGEQLGVVPVPVMRVWKRGSLSRPPRSCCTMLITCSARKG